MELTASKLFRQALVKHWPVYGLGCLTMLVTSTAEVLVPKFVQWGVDFLAGKGNISVLPAWLAGSSPKASLINLILAMLAVLFCGWVGRTGWRQTFGRRTHNAGYQLKQQFWGALRHQPLSFYHRFPLGDLMNRAIGDWNRVRFIHGFTWVLTFDVIYFAILAVIAMLFIDVQLTLLTLLIVPFLPLPILRLTRKEGVQHLAAQERLSSLSDLISQAISTIRLQRATASDGIWQKNLREEAKDYADKSFAVLKTSWRIFPLGALPTLLAYGILLTIGVGKVLSGELSVGEFVAMQSYVLLLQGPLFELSQVFTEWQTGFVSFRRLVEVFREGKAAEMQSAKQNATAQGHEGKIVLRNLSFAYPEHSEKLILDGINLTVSPGARIGFTGPIGSGKSTLLKTMGGMLEGYKGSVNVAGAEVEEANRQWLSSQVIMVPQKAFLFSGSIAYNLCMDADFSEDALWRVLDTVQLADDVRNFPEGLNSWIGEWGINLSGGQKQRLALARTLLRHAPILLLDDCLSAVDAITEEKILAALEEHFKQQTIIWVAHRLSTLKLCQTVYRMEQGQLTPVEVSHGSS